MGKRILMCGKEGGMIAWGWLLVALWIGAAAGYVCAHLMTGRE